MNILCQLLVRMGLAKHPRQAILLGSVVYVCLTFLPLLIICVSQGTALPGLVEGPLSADIPTLTRFLVVGPCLFLSDAITKPWLLKLTETFVAQEMIVEEKLPQYNQLVAKLFKLRESMVVEILLLVSAVLSSCFFGSIILLSDSSHTSWYAVSAAGQASLNQAGLWLTFVSQPLFRFVLLGWIFEYVLWIYFYFRVVALSPRITPIHPDGVGGLGFVGIGQTQFCLSAFALSAAFFSVVGDTVGKTASQQYLTNIGITWVVLMLLLFLGPLLLFSPLLMRRKREAFVSYSNLCHHACDSFARKWLPAVPEYGDAILESDSSSALCDLSADFKAVSDMRVLICGKDSITVFVVAIGLAALPLVASVIPLDELLKQIVKALT